MRKILPFLLALLLAFSLFGSVAMAEEQSEASSEYSAEISEETEASEESSIIVLEDHPNKKYNVAYWIIGFASIAGVVAAAVVISKKMK